MNIQNIDDMAFLYNPIYMNLLKSSNKNPPFPNLKGIIHDDKNKKLRDIIKSYNKLFKEKKKYRLEKKKKTSNKLKK